MMHQSRNQDIFANNGTHVLCDLYSDGFVFAPCTMSECECADNKMVPYVDSLKYNSVLLCMWKQLILGGYYTCLIIPGL